MHAFHEYINRQLADHLKKRRVVVWYDPRGEFRPFIRELHGGSDPMGCMLESVKVGELEAALCVFHGSYFEVKFAVEPHVCVDMPDPLLIYVPATKPPRTESLLLELEKAGDCYEPQLKRLARNVLREQYSDGQIDEMLDGDRTYEDIVGLLQEDEGRQRSMLKVIFSGAQSNADVLAAWLANEASDAQATEKAAKGELFKLIESRLGLSIDAAAELGDARMRTIRYVLVGEFRDDYEGEPPSAAAMIPTPPSPEHTKFVRDVAAAIRQRHAEEYIRLADQVEEELGFASAALPPEKLGKVDTFRFEEVSLLKHVGQLIADRKFEPAAQVIGERRRSFWADQDVRRQNQWEACRLMADVGGMAVAIRKALPASGAGPTVWVDRYTAEDGWYRVDFVHRNLEALIARMTEEPESETAMSCVRGEYERTLETMTRGFIAALQGASWSLSGTLHQTDVQPELVAAKGGRVAYFLVDSMRYEMGVELREQLGDADELNLRPVVAAIPTITPIGMAALLPGASGSFNVIEDGGNLAAEVGGTPLASWAARKKYLQGRVPGLVEVELGKLLDMSARQAEKKIGEAPLIVVRSQEVDSLGESMPNHLARQIIDTAIGNVSRAVRKLAGLGIEQFVIAADHGHLFAAAKEDAMRIDSPGGDKVELHRRCWIGHGGTTPSGTVRVAGAELGYQTDLEFVFPVGVGVFKAGGDLAYHHGGLSLQELIVPALSLRMVRREQSQASMRGVTLAKLPDRITNRTIAVTVTAGGSLFGDEQILVRPVLLRGNVQVGEAGMALDAEFDPRTRCVRLEPGRVATVGLLLQNEECEKLRIAILDPATDTVLAQSGDIAVSLGI